MAVKKHCDTLMEFQGKLLEACQKFESLEEEYLTRMTGFMGKMSDIQNSSHSQMGVVYSSFNEVIQEFSVNKLLSLFVESKGTGKTKPGNVQMVSLEGASLVNPPLSSLLTPFCAVPFKFRPLQAAPASLNASLVDVRPESPGHQRPDKERHDCESRILIIYVHVYVNTEIKGNVILALAYMLQCVVCVLCVVCGQLFATMYVRGGGGGGGGGGEGGGWEW